MLQILQNMNNSVRYDSTFVRIFLTGFVPYRCKLDVDIDEKLIESICELLDF